MGTLNNGEQHIFYGYKRNVDSKSLNQQKYALYPPGIYSVVEAFVCDDTHVGIRSADGLPWVSIVEIPNSLESVQILMTAAVQDVEVSADRPYVVIRYSPLNQQSVYYAEVIGVEWNTNTEDTDPTKMQPNDLIVCRCIFDEQGHVVPRFDYTRQPRIDIGNVFNPAQVFNVMSTEPPSDSVVVTGGKVFINGNQFEVEPTEIQIEPVVHARQDLIYMDSLGGISVASGSDDPEPSIPAMPEAVLPIALITREAASDLVFGEDILNIPTAKHVALSTPGIGATYSGVSAQNIGTGGVGFFKAILDGVIQIKRFFAASKKVKLSDNEKAQRIELDIDEHEIKLANLGERSFNSLTDVPRITTDHAELQQIGKYSHAVVDAHLDSIGNPHQTSASQVGLGNVENLPQVRKSISSIDGHIAIWDGMTGNQLKTSEYAPKDFALVDHDHAAAYEPKAANLQEHLVNTENPHNVTATQLGLGLVKNYPQMRTTPNVSDGEFASWNGTTGDQLRSSGYNALDFARALHVHDHENLLNRDMPGNHSVFQPKKDSTTAFQFLTAGGESTLSVDTVTRTVTVGGVPLQNGLVAGQDPSLLQHFNRKGFVSLAETQVALTGGAKDIVTLQKTGSNWSYVSGNKTITSTDTLSVPLMGGAGKAHSTGLHYIYLEGGLLKARTTAWTLTEQMSSTIVPVAMVVWEPLSVATKAQLIDARQSVLMDMSSYVSLKRTVGLRRYSGGELSGYALMSASDGATRFAISMTELTWMDQILSLSGSSQLSTTAFLYKDAAGKFRYMEDPNGYPFLQSGNVLAYNPAVGGLASLSTRMFCNYYLLFTPCKGVARYTWIAGRTAHTTEQAVREVSLHDDIDFAGIPYPDFIVGYRVTWTVSDLYTNTGKCMLIAKQRLIPTVNRGDGI